MLPSLFSRNSFEETFDWQVLNMGFLCQHSEKYFLAWLKFNKAHVRKMLY